MQLFDDVIQKQLNVPHLYSQEGKGGKAVVCCKFFDSLGSWTWYVLEAEKQEDGDYLFFGLVDGFELELGYFTLSELLSVNEKHQRIERD